MIGTIRPPKEVIESILRVGSNTVMFGGNYFDLPPSPCWIVWNKDNSGDFADCEIAWTDFNSAVRMVTWRWNGMLQQNMKEKEVRVHPTQKPVAVIKWILERYSKEGDLILDPFAGSGTTAVACEQLNRRWIAIEREEQYCRAAKDRLSQPIQKSLLVA